LHAEADLQKEYRTVLTEATVEMEEKKSRFIATVKPVSTEEEAAEFISGLKARFWNASHNVYAYYICADTTLQKFSDDGEPSGTAGLPVLEAVKKLQVQDIVVVVTRYFGGTLLGASGLVRAYGRSAALGIEAACIIKKQLCLAADVVMEYTLLGKVQSIIAARGYKIKNSLYEQDVVISVYVPVDEYEEFTGIITEATNARAFLVAGEKEYITKVE
jgi:uncharacterized YigZ family protein